MSVHPVAPAFFNTTITVLRTPDGNGNACHGKYDVIYGDAAISDSTPDAVFNYQLVDPTPLELRFIGIRVAGQSHHRQLSPASISVDGRMITFSDANTERVNMHLTFTWHDAKNGMEFEHDPGISNGGTTTPPPPPL